ncbi:MAG: type III pantothenate kinase [Burkholderiales bacterium]
MRILAIDAGNSRIKWGWFEQGRWSGRAWLATAEAGKLGAALAAPAPDKIVVSNVAGSAVGTAIAAALAQFATQPRWIRSEPRQGGVTSGYRDPAQLGCDRWAALIGAWHLFRGPCVVVNAGTTMTVDALSDEGVFVGGFIVPGVELMRDSLARHTAQLERQEGRFAYFPDSTADAIISGVINALAGAIERMRHYLEQTGQPAPLIVLSGGDAALIAPQLGTRVEVVDNLVLEGLICIALDPTPVSGER